MLICSSLRTSPTRQEAAGALWNLSFDDGNREAIAAAGGVEALVCLLYKLLFILILSCCKIILHTH